MGLPTEMAEWGDILGGEAPGLPLPGLLLLTAGFGIGGLGGGEAAPEAEPLLPAWKALLSPRRPL